MYGHLPGADHFELVALDDDSRTFRQADPEQIRIPLDDRNEIILSALGIDMLINRRSAQEAESGLMFRFSGHHDFGTCDCAAD